MIKTVSFAPPRASGSRSNAKTSGAKTVPVEALRPATRAASGRNSSKAPAQTSLELMFDSPDEPLAVTAPLATPAVKAVKKAAKTPKPTPVAIPAEIVAEVETPALKVEAKTKEVKAKKVRVPKNLAAQYGEKTAVRPAVMPPVEVESPKKRLNKAERQARRDLMKPSEGLMERLARANQISLRKPPVEPRGKGWKFACGRCGAISYFQTPGGLCACGTIAIKE